MAKRFPKISMEVGELQCQICVNASRFQSVNTNRIQFVETTMSEENNKRAT